MLGPDFALLSDRLTPFLELFDNLKLQEEEIETKIVWLQSKDRFKMAARTGTSPMSAIIDDIFKIIIFSFFFSRHAKLRGIFQTILSFSALDEKKKTTPLLRHWRMVPFSEVIGALLVFKINFESLREGGRNSTLVLVFKEI